MTQTLRRELRMKIKQVLIDADVLDVDNCGWLIDKLTDATLSVSAIAKRATDEDQAEYNTELFRGDYRDYPQSVQEIARVLRDTWKFSLPEKPQKKSKGQYGFYIQAMEAIKQSCAEFGADILVKVHTDWKAGFNNGLAPYTVAQPTSLVNMCAAKARELREEKTDVNIEPKFKNGSGYV